MSAPDLGPLFSAPRIYTDSYGKHWDEEGRECLMVDVDGETTWVPKEGKP